MTHIQKKTAFTLIELLVSITVLALLAGMLMATMGIVREQARKIGCVSNLRQLGLATFGYAGDFDGKLPYEARDYGMLGVLPSFFRSDVWAHDPDMWPAAVWKCPSRKVWGQVSSTGSGWPSLQHNLPVGQWYMDTSYYYYGLGSGIRQGEWIRDWNSMAYTTASGASAVLFADILNVDPFNVTFANHMRGERPAYMNQLYADGHVGTIANLPQTLVRGTQANIPGAPNAMHGFAWISYWFYPGGEVSP